MPPGEETQEQVLEQLPAEPVERVEGQHTKQTAAEIARNALRSHQEPPKPAEGTGEPPEGQQGAQGAAQAQEVITEDEVEQVAEATGVPYAQLVERLQELGIEVESDGIPDDLQPRYATLLERTLSTVEPLLDQDDRYQQSMEEINLFKDRLEKDPSDILLTVAIQKPELFKAAVQTFERMTEDASFKDLVIRELSVAAKERAAQIRERTMTQRELGARGRRAQSLTDAAARKHGVDPAVAGRFVASAVKEVGPASFDMTSIDGLVSQLRPKSAKVAPKTQTPAQRQQVQQTPQTPAASGTPPQQPTGATPVSEGDKHRGGMFRNLLKGARSRVETQMRE